MDIDGIVSIVVPTTAVQNTFEPSSPPEYPFSAAPTVTGFANLFYDTASPAPVTRPLKRRSVSPEASPRHEVAQKHRHSHETERSPSIVDQSSSPAPPSPSQRKFERFASTGGALFKGNAKPMLPAFGSSAISSGKRSRRPTISALVSREGMAESAHSAYPVMEDEKENIGRLPPPRRAFSAMIQAAPSSDDADSESNDYSSPAAHAFAKKQGLRVVRRRDGTDDFRPLTGASALRQTDFVAKASPLRKPASPAMLKAINESPSTRWFQQGMPGFGDNEAHGKVLPCERVKEDGLMRIDCETVRMVLVLFILKLMRKIS